METSNFMCAGFETIIVILNNFLSDPSYDNHFTREDISDFFSGTCNRYLHSFGQGFQGRKNYKKYIDTKIRIFNAAKESKYFTKSELVVDSGGFQASIGFLNTQESYSLIELYHEFLENHHELYNRAFILDLPPGPNCKLFSSFKEIYDLNEQTYLRAANFPDHIRDKLIYIHHFRTPKLWEIYTKILDDNNLFEKFKSFATGGIVANMRSDSAIPCVIYTIPLVPLLSRAKKYNRKHVKFHILGGASNRDILFYEFFKIHVKKIHDIDLEISYDSSGIFKGLMVGRILYIPDGNIVRKANLREYMLDKKFNRNTRIFEAFKNGIDKMAETFNIKKLDIDELYDPKTKTFSRCTRAYASLFVLYTFACVQEICRKSVNEIYPFYENDLQEFNKRIEEVTINLNSNKMTKKQLAKSYSLSNSLDLLTNLDEERCKYIVNRYLCKDEFDYV